MNIFSSIRSQAKLPNGWHYGEGVPASQSAIEGALELCAQLLKRGYSDADMEDFPYSNGKIEVVLEANLEVSFIVENASSVRVRFYTGSEYVLIAAQTTVAEAVEFIPKRECNTFAIYISGTSDEKRKAILAGEAFRTVTEAGSQLSNWIVQIANPEIPATTPHPFTGKLLTHLPRYTSLSGMMSYPPMPESNRIHGTIPATTTSRAPIRNKPTALYARSRIVPWDEFAPAESMAHMW